eukprot:CCRYP_010886-RA/>CCRYP_010886-RA protein AED:0.03 eAED:0.03 QI:0/-1/0/1/-1/1/1/0/643
MSTAHDNSTTANEAPTNGEEEEVQPLRRHPNNDNHHESLDRRIIALIRQCPPPPDDDYQRNAHVIRPAFLASHLGLSLDDATSELCGLLSAVGGGGSKEGGGASFVFEKVESPDGHDGTTMTMVFTFPVDFEARALSYRRKADWYQRLKILAAVVVKVVKIVTAFGLIVSLAVLIVVGVCLLVAAIIALARGGGGGQRGNHHQILTHKLRYLLLQLRQILWLYAICGGGSQDDPFMREVAGDLAFVLSMCVGNPMHALFWMRMGRRRRLFGSSSGGSGWGQSSSWRMRNWRGGGNMDNDEGDDDDGVTMIRRGSWGNDSSSAREERPHRSNSSSFASSQSDSPQQRGLLSVAVEFLFGPNNATDNISTRDKRQGGLSMEELEKWRFRAAIIMALSTASEGKGVSLRELLPYTDNPPESVNDASALRETMKIIVYFNGKPAILPNSSSNALGGIDARFFFPEIMAEMESGIYDVAQQVMSLNSSKFAPPSNTNQSRKQSIASILYKRNNQDDDDVTNVSLGSIPQYLHEKPKVLTLLSQNQFGQCLLLGLLNYVGIVSVQSALMPGGLFDLSSSASSGNSRYRKRSTGDFWISFGSVVLLKLLKILRFYANLFFLLPLCRLVIVLIMNYFIDRRNRRRLRFVTE